MPSDFDMDEPGRVDDCPECEAPAPGHDDDCVTGLRARVAILEKERDEALDRKKIPGDAHLPPVSPEVKAELLRKINED